MSVPVVCPICYQKNPFRYKTEDDRFRYWECRFCGHIEIQRLVNKDDLDTEWDV